MLYVAFCLSRAPQKERGNHIAALYSEGPPPVILASVFDVVMNVSKEQTGLSALHLACEAPVAQLSMSQIPERVPLPLFIFRAP